MRRYLLDTTPLAAYVFGRRAAVEPFQPWLDAEKAATSVLVYTEVVECLRSLSNIDYRLDGLRELLAIVCPYYLTYPILERYSLTRRQLRPPHGPGLIGDIDTLIAATALKRNLIVVTCDTDYERITGLKTLVIPRSDFQLA